MVYEKKYGNGLRLVVKQMEGLLSVTMGILVGTGSSWETDSEDGISHFIEHMQFKGTKKRTRIGCQNVYGQSLILTCCVVSNSSNKHII